MVTNIYNLVDTAFVGTLGTSESGATGIVFGYMAILQAIAFMCGQGLGSTETIAPSAGTYIFYILISAPFFTSSLSMNNLLRYEGKAKFGTIGLMIGAVINIFGDLILILGFKLGIRALRLMCVGQLFVPLTMMVEMGFQSIGEKLLASFASCLRSGLLFIPTLLILKNIRGISGVQEAQPLSFVFTFIVCLFLCRIYLKHVRD